MPASWSPRASTCQLAARLVPGLSLTGGVAYTDARFRSFKGDLCYPGQTDVASAASRTRRAIACPMRRNGRRWATSATNGRSRRRSNGSVQVGVTSQTSAWNISPAPIRNGHLGGFTTLDVMLGLAGPGQELAAQPVLPQLHRQVAMPARRQYPLVPSDYLQNYSYGAFRSLGASLEFSF
jgi:hypothetical protein